MIINDILIDNNNLKGGYISDVIKVNIVLNNKKVINTIFKMENKNENNLSIMANNLKLYEREYYFYESIYNYVNLDMPKFYGIVRNDNFEKIGIILENLDDKTFKLNIDLNKQSFDKVLIYLSTIAQLHAQFSNKNLNLRFTGLYKNNSPELNNKFICDFIDQNIQNFIEKWKYLINDNVNQILNLIAIKYEKIQNKLSEGILTLCHGDFKSPNIL